eukprot:13334016-Alexandrium_andersonii.AAC.1
MTAAMTACPKRARTLSRKLSKADSALLLAPSANMATRTSPELLRGSFWTPFGTERRGDDD